MSSASALPSILKRFGASWFRATISPCSACGPPWDACSLPRRMATSRAASRNSVQTSCGGNSPAGPRNAEMPATANYELVPGLPNLFSFCRETRSPRVRPLPNGRGSAAESRSVNAGLRATTVREWLLLRRTAVSRLNLFNVEGLLQLLHLRLGSVQIIFGLGDIPGVERRLGAIQKGVHQTGRRLYGGTHIHTHGGLRALHRLQAGADDGGAHANPRETLADLSPLHIRRCRPIER